MDCQDIASISQRNMSEAHTPVIGRLIVIRLSVYDVIVVSGRERM